METRKSELPSDTPARGAECEIELEGKRLTAYEGEPLMITLLAHGIETASRSVKYHRPRGAFCLSGICGQCWMRIDDLPNRAACTTRVHDGLVAIRENAFPSADFDIFRAADKLFAGGLDHHRLGTTPLRPLNSIMNDTARRMAGLGELSTTAPAPARAFASRAFDVVVIGAGPAGLAAARAAASAGLRVLVVEARGRAGGQLATRLYDDVAALAELPAAARAALDAANGELWTTSIALGVYLEHDHAKPELLVRRMTGTTDEHLVLIRAETMILANGGYEQTPLFEANDLPGHYGARAFAQLVLGYRVLPGKRVVIADSGIETGARLFERLKALEVEVIRVVEDGTSSKDVRAGRVVVAARGGTHVKGVEIASPGATDDDARERIACDLIASAMPVAPAFELGRQAGCAIDHRPQDGGFAIAADPRTGKTSVEWIYAAGDVTGAKTAIAAMTDGEIAGLSAVLAKKDDAGARNRRDELMG